jgi:hypothetical protein
MHVNGTLDIACIFGITKIWEKSTMHGNASGPNFISKYCLSLSKIKRQVHYKPNPNF